MITRCLFIGILLLLVCGLMLADEGRKGQAGFQFLRIPIGARQVSMGNSGLANSIGAAAVYWNPAGVALQKGYEAQFSNLQWFGDISYRQFTGVAGVSALGTVGFFVQYLGYPDIVETTEEAPDGTGATFAPYDIAVGLNLSRQMTDRVAFGINLKYISENIALVSASAFAVDIGLTYNTGYQGLQLGFAIQNYGTKGEFTGSGLRRFILRSDGPPNQTPVPVLFESDQIELPSSVQAGLSFLPFKNENISVLVSADHVVNTFSANRTNFGAELGYNDVLFLRGGGFHNSDFSTTNKVQFTFGAGLYYEVLKDLRVKFDYAYADLGLLKNAQYITVGLQF